MNIEVTKSTFYKVIKGNDLISTDEIESSRKHYYHNRENNQGGCIVENFTSSATIIQYYLTDINA